MPNQKMKSPRQKIISALLDRLAELYVKDLEELTVELNRRFPSEEPTTLIEQWESYLDNLECVPWYGDAITERVNKIVREKSNSPQTL